MDEKVRKAKAKGRPHPSTITKARRQKAELLQDECKCYGCLLHRAGHSSDEQVREEWWAAQRERDGAALFWVDEAMRLGRLVNRLSHRVGKWRRKNAALHPVAQAAKELFDNRLGHSEGQPHAPRELWAKLGAALYGKADPRVAELVSDEPRLALMDEAAQQ